MRGDVKKHLPKEGAVLGLPPILLISAQSRRESILSEWSKQPKRPDKPAEDARRLVVSHPAANPHSP